ncbi:Reticulon-4 receptor-like 2 [Heterocephalus glaber]|uniref:Reticulon-4 receptor-like 2 n=1 Tax=Heterocephalus glaber TaxID=10181 RepID=G5BLJ0_HETGA|nr:Reticulon-4 receptor-like 2 [Heterocephalus glaber]
MDTSWPTFRVGVRPCPAHAPLASSSQTPDTGHLCSVPNVLSPGAATVGARLSSLPSTIFRGLVSLQYLYLQDNSLLHLQDDLFADLANLSHLFLHGNRLRLLTEHVFRGLGGLDRLLLHGNRLQGTPGAPRAPPCCCAPRCSACWSWRCNTSDGRGPAPPASLPQFTFGAALCPHPGAAGPRGLLSVEYLPPAQPWASLEGRPRQGQAARTPLPPALLGLPPPEEHCSPESTLDTL